MAKKIKVEGLKDLEASLRELGKEYGNPKYAVQAMRPAVRAAMEGVDDKIEQATPVDTGGLKDSTNVKIGKATKKILKSKHFNPNTIIVGRAGYFWKDKSLWNQALAVEFGNEKKVANSPLRNTMTAEHQGMLKRFKETLGPAIEKKGKALNKKRGKK